MVCAAARHSSRTYDRLCYYGYLVVSNFQFGLADYARGTGLFVLCPCASNLSQHLCGKKYRRRRGTGDDSLGDHFAFGIHHAAPLERGNSVMAASGIARANTPRRTRSWVISGFVTIILVGIGF